MNEMEIQWKRSAFFYERPTHIYTGTYSRLRIFLIKHLRNVLAMEDQVPNKALWLLNPLEGANAQRSCCEDDSPNFSGNFGVREAFLLSLISSNKGGKIIIFGSRDKRLKNNLSCRDIDGDQMIPSLLRHEIYKQCTIVFA